MLTIALIGCSKRKSLTGPSLYCPARDLYDSDLFRKRVAHVEARGLPWYILSAKCGVLKPEVQIRTYDKTLRDLSELEVAEWHVGVVSQLLGELYERFGAPKLSTVNVEIHAGAKYCEPLTSILAQLKIRVTRPVESLGIGEQLAFYKGA